MWMQWTVITIGVVLMVGRLIQVWSRGHRARGRWQRAVEACEKGDLAAAEADLRKVVGLMPIWAPARRVLGATLAGRGRFAEAEEQFRMAAQLEPRNGTAHWDLGMFLASCPPQRPEEAIEAFERAIEFAPDLRQTLGQFDQLAPLRAFERFRGLLPPGDTDA
ncbi:MAG: hypothetical protein JXR94_07890 [Candidatus Hydrogenedentes bacterium]|nr:hypothetical protein [Candidatus Hydrogenedentota bacterium]